MKASEQAGKTGTPFWKLGERSWGGAGLLKPRQPEMMAGWTYLEEQRQQAVLIPAW